jgi:hypothetical protein
MDVNTALPLAHEFQPPQFWPNNAYYLRQQLPLKPQGWLVTRDVTVMTKHNWSCCASELP